MPACRSPSRQVSSCFVPGASHAALLAPRDARQRELLEKFGFVCACEVCTLVGAARAESDARREALRETYAAHMRGAFGDPMEGLCEVRSPSPLPSTQC